MAKTRPTEETPSGRDPAGGLGVRPAGPATAGGTVGALERVRWVYDADPDREWRRLDGGAQARLEQLITLDALERFLPPAPHGRRGGGGGRAAPGGAPVRVEAVLEGSITDLSVLPDGAFDAVLCLGGPLSHLVDPAARRPASDVAP